jgi:hypothetical protein
MQIVSRGTIEFLVFQGLDDQEMTDKRGLPPKKLKNHSDYTNEITTCENVPRGTFLPNPVYELPAFGSG